jgi:phosphoribosylaminoimidazolecarboxamide formyltransferase/IMP cyclohydrolase
MAQQLLQTENYWQQLFMFHLIMTPIFNYFNTDETIFKASIADGKILRYGENPHQKDSSLVILKPCLINYTEKNYHTITYVDAAVTLISEFKTDDHFRHIKTQ